ncbi:MAG: hypothetical protein K9J06_01440 [Flavobacteriales bacterium]|nr:hypothetical protein [Flavobacteriales bacterium]
MRKQDRILALIRSLDQGEKKYFVQRSRSGSKTKGYIRLYELLSAKESYDPDELCRQLGKDKTGLANEKKYLEKQLLSALREYHEAHPHIAALNRIAEGVLLMERNLNDLAEASLANSIQRSSTSGLLPLEWHAHGLMLTLCGHPFAAVPKKADHHLEQLQQLAARIKLSADFEWLNNEVFAAYEKRKVDITDRHRNETLRLLNHRLLRKDYDYFLFASYKHSLQSLLYSRMGNIEANIEANRKLVALLEIQPEIDAMAYWSAIANLTQSIIAGGDKHEYDLWMDRLQSRYYRKLPVDADYVEQLLIQYRNIFRSGVLFRQLFSGEVPREEVHDLTETLLTGIEREKRNTPPFHYTSTFYKAAACALVSGYVDNCVELLNILLNDVETQVNATANKNARLLFIMAHIQKQNLTLLPSLIGSMSRHLRKSNEDHSVELVLLKQFEERVNVHNDRGFRKWLSDFKKALKELEQQTTGKKLLNMIPILAWIRNLEKAGQNPS